MSQKPPTAVRAIPSPPEVNIAQEAVRFLKVIRQRRRLVIFSLLASAALGGLYFATAPRIYRSEASLLVQQNEPDTWTKNGGNMMVKDLMDTYQSMLSSEAVLSEALRTMPEQARAQLAAGAGSRNILTFLRKYLNISVVRKTNILEISYCSESPQVAATVVDNVLSAYLKFMDKLHKSTALEMLETLGREKARLETDLEAKEGELLTLKHQIGDVILREGENYVSMLAKGLEGDFELLRKVQGSRLESESQLGALETAIRNGEDLQQYALTLMTAGGSEELEKRLGPDSTTLSRVREQLLQDVGELRSVQERYGPAHSKVRELQEKIQVAERFLQSTQLGAGVQALGTSNQELAGALQRIARQRFETAREHERLVVQSYESKKAAAMEVQGNMARLEVLNRDLNRMYNSLDVLTEHIKGIEIGKDNGMLGTAVLSTPEVPKWPIRPSLPIVAMLALLAGLAGGIAGAFAVDMLDDRFGSVEELAAQLGGLPVLAMVRKLESTGEVGLEALHAYARPNDTATEAFRTLRTALALMGEDIQTVVISSAEPGDGKTTVMANLGVAVAQSGKKTLLIDADIRRPRLTPLLGLRGRPGLTTVLGQAAALGETSIEPICTALMPGLDVLPAGPRATNPAELLAGDRLPELLSWAESKYDYILIDSSPAFVSDVAIIGRLADGVALVVRPDKNRRRMVIRAVESLATLGVRLVGVVLNGYTAEEDPYGYRYEYGYRYDYSTSGEEAEGEDVAIQPIPIKRRSA